MAKNKKKSMSVFSRIIYAIVGIFGVVSIIWAFTFGEFITMPLWSILAFIMLVIGGLNWGIVAITGDRNSDLFGLLGL